MPAYPNLDNLTEGAGISELMALPNSTHPFYWTIIMVGLWAIVSLTMYFTEKERRGIGNLLSSMAVASLAIIMLSTIATLTGMITMVNFIPLLVGGLLIIAIWIFSSGSR